MDATIDRLLLQQITDRQTSGMNHYRIRYLIDGVQHGTSVATSDSDIMGTVAAKARALAFKHGVPVQWTVGSLPSNQSLWVDVIPPQRQEPDAGT